MERFTQRNSKGRAVCRGITVNDLVHCTEIVGGEAIEYFAELEDKLENGQLADTTPYIVEIKGNLPFKYKVIKPTIVRRNVEMCIDRESAEKRIAKLPKKLAEPIDAEQFTKATAKAILQNLYKFAKDGTRNEDTGYACAFYRIIEKLLAGAKHYGVEIEK